MKSFYFKRSYWLLVFFLLILVHSCVTEDPEPGELPSLITLTASEITSNSATAEGSVSGLNIVSRGIVFNTAGDPNLENDAQVKTAGEGEGSFQAELTGLEANTEYFFKAFASNSEGTAYGSERAFTTLPGMPTVAMDSVTALSPTAIRAYATVIGAATDNKGIVIGNSNTVTLEDGEKFGESEGQGQLEITIEELTDGTIYFVKAYVISSFGTTYSEAIEVQTLEFPFEASLTSIEEITSSGATINAEVEGKDVLMKGIIYGDSEALSFDQDQFTENGAGEGSFNATLEGLNDAEDYFAQVYAIDAEDTIFSELTIFTTNRIPLAATVPVSSQITSTSFIAEANVEGSRISEAGFVYGETDNPDLLNATKLVSGNGPGNILVNVSELNSNTDYFIRAYVTSDIDTAYSETLAVTTMLTVATVTTEAVSEITFTSATSGGEVIGEEVQQKGVVWSTTTGPTLNDSKTENGPGAGTFAAEIAELTTKTSYFIRAYATNAAGTAYGNELSFTTGGNLNVESINPASGATGVDKNENIEVSFDERIDLSTITAENLRLTTSTVSGNIGIDVSQASDGNLLTINPNSSLLDGEVYTLIIETTVESEAGFTLASNYTSSFTVDPGDVTAPTVSSVGFANTPSDTPGPNPTANSAIFVSFSEAIDPSTVNGSNFRLFRGSTQVAVTVGSQSNTIVYLDPTSTLFSNAEYQVRVSGVRDLAGNTLAGTFTSNFSTPNSNVNVTLLTGGAGGNNLVGVEVDANMTIQITGDAASSNLTAGLISLTRNGSNVPITLSINSSGDIVVNPNSDLTEFLTDYELRVSTGLTNTLGAVSTTSHTQFFKTIRFSTLYWYSFQYFNGSGLMAVSSSSNPSITFQAESNANSNRRSDFSITEGSNNTYSISHSLFPSRRLEDILRDDNTPVQLTTSEQRTYKWYFDNGPNQDPGRLNTYNLNNKSFLFDTNAFLLGTDSFGVGKTMFATYNINISSDSFKALYEIEVKRRGRK